MAIPFRSADRAGGASAASARRLCAAALVLLLASTLGCASFGRSPLQKAQDAALDQRLKAAHQQMPKQRSATTLDEKLVEGDRMRDTGHEDRAMLAYLEAVRMDPAAASPRERIGYLQLGHDTERAEAIFLQLSTEDATSASAWRGLGLARIARGNLHGATTALERALELDSESAGAHYALATALGLQGRAEEAVPHAERSRELRPKDGAVANILGVSLMLGGDPVGAEEPLRAAIHFAPDIPAYHNNLALCLAKQQRYDEALQSFLRGGGEQAAYNNLGYSYFLDGRYADAISHYESALAMPGDHKLEVLRNLNEALDARAESNGPSGAVASPRP